MFDGKAFGEEMVAIIRGYVDKATAPLLARIGELEAQKAVGVAGAVIDRSGHLVITLTDGTAKDVGPVVGKDADMNRLEGLARELVASIPTPQDALGFDDLDLVETEEGVALRFARGDSVKEFPLPVIIDRGVFKEGAVYRKGNGVTWGGSFWIAQKDSPEGKPDSPDSGWRLAVKRGQNGKAA